MSKQTEDDPFVSDEVNISLAIGVLSVVVTVIVLALIGLGTVVGWVMR